MTQPAKKQSKKVCVRVHSHRPGVYCKTCGTTPKERGA